MDTFSEYNGRLPTIKEMDPFYPIFLERDLKEVKKNKLTIKLGGDNNEDVVEQFLASRPEYMGFNAFIEAWKGKK